MYAVLFTYNFDEDSSVVLFDDEEKAKDFLYNSFDEERRIEMDEYKWGVASLVTPDKTYACITYTRFKADGEDYEDVCEYRLCYDVRDMRHTKQ